MQSPSALTEHVSPNLAGTFLLHPVLILMNEARFKKETRRQVQTANRKLGSDRRGRLPPRRPFDGRAAFDASVRHCVSQRVDEFPALI